MTIFSTVWRGKSFHPDHFVGFEWKRIRRQFVFFSLFRNSSQFDWIVPIDLTRLLNERRNDLCQDVKIPFESILQRESSIDCLTDEGLRVLEMIQLTTTKYSSTEIKKPISFDSFLNQLVSWMHRKSSLLFHWNSIELPLFFVHFSKNFTEIKEIDFDEHQSVKWHSSSSWSFFQRPFLSIEDPKAIDDR